MTDQSLTPTQEATTAAIDMYKGQKTSTLIMVIGKSGRGKSAAMRNMDPNKTFFLNVKGKLLPFQEGLDWSLELNNTHVTSDAATISRVLTTVSREGKFDNIVIDDSQYIMADEFFDKALVKGYEKFAAMGQHFWSILNLASKLRSGLKIYILSHEDDKGHERCLKTLGKMLEDKGCPEGLATIVLFAETRMDNNKRVYYFDTQTDGITTAKSPFGMFPDKIPNDLQLVSSRVDEYYSRIKLKDSKLDFTV